MPSAVLVVNEITTEREEIARALEAEGFMVVQASSASEATREIWGGSFTVVVISTLLTGTTTASLQQQMTQISPIKNRKSVSSVGNPLGAVVVDRIITTDFCLIHVHL